LVAFDAIGVVGEFIVVEIVGVGSGFIFFVSMLVGEEVGVNSATEEEFSNDVCELQAIAKDKNDAMNGIKYRI
tara:strand:+ start:249 stop:467 length:219 start_codon:yes stop_codon:yes gene_type:complete